MKHNASSQKTRSAVDTIIYEYKMFSFASAEVIRLQKGPRKTRSARGRWNLALEGALLHARNLRDFFTGTNRNDDDDIAARDFLGIQPRWRLTKLRSLAVRTRLNKKLAHPTYSRSRYTGSWPVSLFRDEINGAWELFLARLDSNRPDLRQLFTVKGF